MIQCLSHLGNDLEFFTLGSENISGGEKPMYSYSFSPLFTVFIKLEAI